MLASPAPHVPTSRPHDTSPELRTVGEIVRTLRGRRRLEQIELARICGWQDASAVSRIETDRVHPTKRTLVKLAEGLTAGSAPEVRERTRSLLLHAAGIPPAPAEIDALEASLPPITSWPYPAGVIDFAWYVWRTNDPLRRMLGLTRDVRGRNLLEILFEGDGAAREHLGPLWQPVATSLARRFLSEAAGREHQRWHRLLSRRLSRYHDLQAILASPPTQPASAVRGRTEVQDAAGTAWGVLAAPLEHDPRVRILHLLPDNDGALEYLGTRSHD